MNETIIQIIHSHLVKDIARTYRYIKTSNIKLNSPLSFIQYINYYHSLDQKSRANMLPVFLSLIAKAYITPPIHVKILRHTNYQNLNLRHMVVLFPNTILWNYIGNSSNINCKIFEGNFNSSRIVHIMVLKLVFFSSSFLKNESLMCQRQKHIFIFFFLFSFTKWPFYYHKISLIWWKIQCGKCKKFLKDFCFNLKPIYLWKCKSEIRVWWKWEMRDG